MNELNPYQSPILNVGWKFASGVFSMALLVLSVGWMLIDRESYGRLLLPVAAIAAVNSIARLFVYWLPDMFQWGSHQRERNFLIHSALEFLCVLSEVWIVLIILIQRSGMTPGSMDAYVNIVVLASLVAHQRPTTFGVFPSATRDFPQLSDSFRNKAYIFLYFVGGVALSVVTVAAGKGNLTNTDGVVIVCILGSALTAAAWILVSVTALRKMTA